MALLIRAVLLIHCVEAVGLLRYYYGMGFACLMVLGITIRYMLCAWLLPVLPMHLLLMYYATLFIGLNTLRACVGFWRGSTTPFTYTGHSWLWKVGIGTRTTMLVTEPLLALLMAATIFLGGARGVGLVALPWPYTSVQPLLERLPTLPQGYYAFLDAYGALVALGAVLVMPLALWTFNKLEYDTFPGPRQAAPSAMPAPPDVTFEEVQAAPGYRNLPVPSAARLAAAERIHRKASSTS